ncbi:YqgE/AlgH family protein [Stappia sp. ES.058]|uniref:YqgE/AlgH family protein n=1 Tax=Stappia sp. ES.058 TaxID=1881061 RepID=UPI00087B1978|nr:YqgE/AlgH family protein [Stappia sp. ES.058]SDT92001.1 putative transcriptional regulator [Stappia sp. ES.058]
MTDSDFLTGRLLIAMPQMADERFAHAVVYLCSHSTDGAMGIVVNQPAANLTFPDLLRQLDLIPEAADIVLPSLATRMQVHRGGPVETGRGFVLHSQDFIIDNSTMLIEDGICLTATLDILRAIAEGRGPSEAMLALGYAGWGAGQLETEIQENGWIIAPADPAILFDRAVESKWDRALAKLGISPGMLSSEAGHA